MSGRTLSLALLLLLGLSALAACTPGNTAPSVTITSPTDGTTVTEDDPVLLSADADDPEDGDVGTSLQWSSDLDGALTPDASDEVTLSPGVHTLTATATDSSGASGSDSVALTVIDQATPEVSITSPTDGATVAEGNAFVLEASATDAEEGDLSGDVEWSSDLDGPLAPDASGEVRLSVGTHVLTASVTDSTGRVGTDSVTVEVTEGIATHVIADGLTLRLVAVEDAQLVEVAFASIPSDGLLDVHAIFNVVPHPSEPWLYAASANECGVGDEGCWGNARIDRFVVHGDTIEHDGAAFVYDATQTDVSCTQVDYGYGEAQVGACAPIGMAFSSDAARFYVDDDELDGIHVFDVDGDGDLTFVAEGGSTSAHGLAIDPTDSYLYNGASVIDVTADLPTDVVSNDRGNATALVEAAGGADLISTVYTGGVALYDLTDPLAPVEVAAYDFGTSNQARDLDFGPSLDRIVAVGRNVVHSLSFAADTFTLDDTYTAAEAFDVEYRGVALAGDGASVIATWFGWDADVPVGGIDLFTLAGDGTLDRIDRLENGGGSRVVIALP